MFTTQTDGGEVLWGRPVSTDGWGGMPKFRSTQNLDPSKIYIYAKFTFMPKFRPIHFFGDRQDPAGNDYQLAQTILTKNLGKCYHVSDWQHTWKLLKDLNDT